MKRLLILLLLIGTVGGAYAYMKTNNISLAEEIDSLSEGTIEEVQDNTAKQFGEFTQRAKAVSEQTKKVLGESVQTNEQEPSSIQARAVEYGQYLYCQQVVKTYEQKN